MNDAIIIKKCGKFYQVYDNNAYILHYLMNYKISKNRVGFPLSAINKVISELETRKINYMIITNDEVLKRKFPINKYGEYLTKGKEAYAKYKSNEELAQKIKNLSKEQMDLIIDYIKELYMDNDKFKIVINAKNLVNYINEIVINYPRAEYNLKNRLVDDSYELLKLIYYANIIENRLLVQKSILVNISMIDFYLELSY